MLFPSALLVMACLVVGMFPARTIGPYLDVASRSVLSADMPFHSLAVWHGVNLPLIMSLVAMVAESCCIGRWENISRARRSCR